MQTLYTKTSEVKTVTNLYLVVSDYDEQTFTHKIFTNLSEARCFARKASSNADNMWFYIESQDLRNSSSKLKRMNGEEYYHGKRIVNGRAINW